MIARKLMISGLQRQNSLLGELISQMEQNPMMDSSECALYEERVNRIAHNLKSLRKIKNQYFSYLDSLAYLD